MTLRSLLFALLAPCLTIQAQDDCNSALAIVAGTYTVAGIDGPEIGLPYCANTGTATHAEWYIYTAPADTMVRVTTDLSTNLGGDTRIHVYTGSCGALTCVGGDDDGGSGYLSTVDFSATAGTEYHIVFDDRWSIAGFDFQVSELVPPPPPPPAPVTFTSTTLSSSGPLGIVDMDDDDLDDLVVPGTTFLVIHKQQPGGGFVATTINHPGVSHSPSWSMAAGDIDGNGYTDLIYGGGSGASFMMAGPNGTTYSEVNFPQYIFCQRTNMVDINNDGHLDAFSCHDVDANVYFLNDGFGNLTYFQGGLGSTCGNYGSIWTDYDNDGDMDCFVAKCGCDPVDLLMRNDGSGQFSSVATAADFADNHQSWSSAWGDFDNDGDMDVVVGSSSSSYHKVMANDGTGNFTNVTVGSGFDNFSGQSIEWTAHDFDNDGFLDVMGGGSLMMGNGDLTFTQVAGTFSNGPMGDVNNDGFVDYMNGGTAKVNDGNSNHYLKVATHGTISNRDGIGARVEVVSALGTQIRDVKSGDGFRYMSSLNTHFGLGQDEFIERVTVYWPSGITQTILAPPIDTLLVIEEAISTSVNDGQVIQDLSVYPNPAKDILTLKSPIELRGSLIQVVDAAGRVVLERVLQQNQIDLADLATGVYTVRAYAADRTLSLPFMKE